MIQLRQWISALSHCKSRHINYQTLSSLANLSHPLVEQLISRESHANIAKHMMNYFAKEIYALRANIIFLTGEKMCGKSIICPQNRHTENGAVWLTALHEKNRTVNLTASFRFKFQMLQKPMIKTWNKPTRLISWEARPRWGLGLFWRSHPWNGLQTAGLIWTDHQATVLRKERETGELWVWKDILRQSHSWVKNVST